MQDKNLEAIGRQWLHVVELVKRDDCRDEHDHVRFRDSDLSVKGAAILGFSCWRPISSSCRPARTA